jgi:prolyl-tRNA synthetase
MGALIMAHSDDEGLVLPPVLAPVQIVIVPIYKGSESLAVLAEACQLIAEECKAAGLRVELDAEDNARPGWKFAHHELRGVPIRIAVGMRDLQNGEVELARRDLRTKTQTTREGLGLHCKNLLDEIQNEMFNKALAYRSTATHRVDTKEEFLQKLEQGGLVMAHWDGTTATETAIKEATKATIRCIPLDAADEPGNCVWTGRPSARRVVFAKAY